MGRLSKMRGPIWKKGPQQQGSFSKETQKFREPIRYVMRWLIWSHIHERYICVCLSLSLSLPHTRLCHYLTHPLFLDFFFFLETAINIEGGGHTQQASAPSSKMHWSLPPPLVCSGAATISSFDEFSGSFCKKICQQGKGAPDIWSLFLGLFSMSLF